MVTCIFILGRPGSGKSSIAQHIYFSLQRYGWYVEHLYDYKLLQERFLQEIHDDVPLQKRQFWPRGPESMYGFDVTDHIVLDEVLRDIAKKADSIRKNVSAHENTLLLIEFARNNYRNALSLFDQGLLQGAHILYIDASIGACIKRIDQRIDSRSEYGHYVSHEIMWKYYLTDDWLDGRCQEYLKNLEESGTFTYLNHIVNSGLQDELTQEVDKFIKLHLLREMDTEATPIVQNTEAIPIVSPKPFQTESAK